MYGAKYISNIKYNKSSRANARASQLVYIIGCGCTVAVNYLNPVPQTVVCDLRSVVMKIGGYTI
jgi:hypothetical protein